MLQHKVGLVKQSTGGRNRNMKNALTLEPEDSLAQGSCLTSEFRKAPVANSMEISKKEDVEAYRQ